jgi:class 3 adenylate cyclase
LVVAALPTGTVTFLFTDLEGSTRLWDEHSEEMRAALVRPDQILRDAVGSHHGQVIKTTGDGPMRCSRPPTTRLGPRWMRSGP